MLDVRIVAIGVALGLFAVPLTASALESPDQGTDQGALAAEPDAPPGLLVVVDAQAAQLDAHQVRRSIEQELAVPVYGEPNPRAVGTLRVSAVGNDDLIMVYEGTDGRRHERTVSLPQELDKRLETVALVAGNLVRDETGELIEALRPRAEQQAPPPEAEEREPAAASEPAPKAAAAPPVSVRAANPPAFRRELVNLALFHPYSLYSNSHELELVIDLGLAYSHVARVNGAALSCFVSRVSHGFSGAQVAGVSALSLGDTHGLALAGIFAQQLGEMHGALVGGAVAHSSGSLDGMALSGAVGVHQGPVRGAQVAGAVAVAGEVSGVQLGGAVNLAQSLEGVMVAGAGNLTLGAAEGVQLAAFNLAESIAGLQVGVVNIGGRVDGMQLGVVNVAEEVDGVSLGVVSIAGNGRQHLLFWTSPGHAIANLGAKFRVGPVYSLLAMGYQGAEQEGDSRTEARILPGAAVGVHLDIERAFVELDAMVQTEQVIENLDEQRELIALRPQLGFAVVPWLAVFGGLAAEASLLDHDWSQGVRFRGFGGVQLF